MESQRPKIESLRSMLQKMEAIRGTARSPQDFVELRRILLKRISELEAAEAVPAPPAGVMRPRRAA